MPDTDAALHPQLYRAITKKSWYQGRVLSAAFVLRVRDLGRLSLIKAPDRCTPDNTVENCSATQRECYGEFILDTARIRQLGLGVEDDDPEEEGASENHASITGLPEPHDDLKLVEDRATELASISALHWDRFGRF